MNVLVKPPTHIELRYAAMSFDGYNAHSTFFDGRAVVSWPHPDQHDYHIISERCGYNFDLARYNFEHEFCHHFLAERLFDRPSPVLWAVAHSEPPPPDYLYEEIAVQTFQAWLRSNVRPIVADCNWGDLKLEALAYLGDER